MKCNVVVSAAVVIVVVTATVVIVVVTAIGCRVDNLVCKVVLSLYLTLHRDFLAS